MDWRALRDYKQRIFFCSITDVGEIIKLRIRKAVRYIAKPAHQEQPFTIPGFTAEQNTSLQVFISAEITAQLAASNQAILDEMKASLKAASDNTPLGLLS